MDYSQTVNRFTYLDAYPLPRIDELVGKISQYEIYTTLDLQSVACFQRHNNNIITKANLKDTFAYVDNVTICGQNMSKHNINYGESLNAAKEYGLTFDEDKTTIAARTKTLLGFQISHGVILPNPERFRALREIPPPPTSNLSRGPLECGPVLLKKQQRASKYDPLVEEVELLDCNPKYAHVRLPNEKEETVSVKHLAPRGEPDDLGTSECLADANDLNEATEIAHKMCSNDQVADSPTPTNYELLKQKQQRLHPYTLRSREA
ncbi:uncharacterized protein DEA37_0001169 [Paragonimus westermani]|uniref:Reverse transcriptase domain-containing protein n=1 Tax=Paragonimus westermani TaxID=34504 RepID=A0A5J4NHD6_9TREM|nr:uncharacterized protein DEA37_0001169 [Paragonimus westermani]